MKRLIIVRHAKSSWEKPAPDLERALAKRGEDDIHLMFGKIKDFIKPDLIVSSPAKRAFMTANLLAKVIEYNDKIMIMNELYFEGIESSFEKLSNLFVDCDTILIVGHNPEITDLYNHFSDKYLDNIPTCGLFIIDLKKTKPYFDGKIRELYYPKMFKKRNHEHQR